MIAPFLMVVGGFLLILVAVYFMLLSNQAPATEPTQVSTNIEATVQAMKRVSLGDAKAAFDLKTAVFLDARDTSSYAQSHIPGAINIPENELASRSGELNKNDWIITYCT
jgi:3-mercaptopyruvate sulfurtransferase SseA